MKRLKKIFFVFFSILTIIFCLSNYNDNKAFCSLEYKKEDISKLFYKNDISDEDLKLIYRQTGISPLIAKKLIESENYAVLEKLNDLYFKKPLFKKKYIAFLVTVEELNNFQITPVADLEKGDILISFNTHTFLWRHGHSAIVLDEDGTLLEHLAVGEKSCLTNAKDWGRYPSFIVLRHKDKKIASLAADYAKEKLVGIDYNIMAGILKKDKSDEKFLKSSHCSHLVWQAYKAVGIDIDSNKGVVVTPLDITNSNDLNVVQIYGCNPEKYQNRILQ